MALSVRRLREDERKLLGGLRIIQEAESFLSVDMGVEGVGEVEDWGLWLGEQLIGWCRLVKRSPVLWVSRILIDAPYTGLGYGKVLLKTVLAETGRSWRWREVRAAVHPENLQARSLFEGLGFEALPYVECIGEIILQKSLR